MAHTSNRENDIWEMTIPRIEAYQERLPNHIEIKMGLPGIGGSGKVVETGKPLKLSDLDAMSAMFAGI